MYTKNSNFKKVTVKSGDDFSKKINERLEDDFSKKDSEEIVNKVSKKVAGSSESKVSKKVAGGSESKVSKKVVENIEENISINLDENLEGKVSINVYKGPDGKISVSVGMDSDVKASEEENNVIFILDRSGSMYNQVEDTIGGYNSFIQTEKSKGRNTYITTVLFDNHYELLVDHQHIDDVKELTSKEYYARGATALLDAIGKTINTVAAKAKGKTLFVITTDGLENASCEFTKSDIKKLIESHEDFEFMYIGANIDSYSEASKLGIKVTHTANRSPDSVGNRKMYDAISIAREDYLKNNVIRDNWKKDLEDF